MFRSRPYRTLFAAASAVALLSSLAFAQTNNATKRTVPRAGGLGNKVPELPANLFTAAGTVARSQLKHEWVDIPAGKVKLHTWIHYPQGDGTVPVVLLMHLGHGSQGR
jgi:hypothetical protein